MTPTSVCFPRFLFCRQNYTNADWPAPHPQIREGGCLFSKAKNRNALDSNMNEVFVEI